MSEDIKKQPEELFSEPIFYVVIDTNALFGDFFFKKPETTKLFEVITRHKNIAVLSQVSIEEHRKNFAEELETNNNQLVKSANKLKRFLEIDVPVLPNTYKRGLDAFEARLRQVIVKYKIQILDYPQVQHKEIVHRCQNRLSPFDEKDRGYKDYLIWCSIINLLKSTTETIYYITNDDDFLEKGTNSLKNDLKNDLQQLAISVDRLQIFRNIETFNAQKVDPFLKTFLSQTENIFIGKMDSFKNSIIQKGIGLLDGLRISEEELYYHLTADNSEPKIFFSEPIDEIENVEIKRTQLLDNLNIYVEVELAFECLIHFFIDTGEFYQTDNSKITIVETSIDNSYYLAQSKANINAIVEVQTDQEAEIHSISVKSYNIIGLI